MLGDIAIYYIFAVVLIWVTQLVMVQTVNIREKNTEALLGTNPDMNDPAVTAIVDRFIRNGSIVRMLFKVTTLVLLGFGAWFFGSKHDGWWWVFWLMFAYNLVAALYTSMFDITAIATPGEVRRNPGSFKYDVTQGR